jgi:hypothetical protein
VGCSSCSLLLWMRLTYVTLPGAVPYLLRVLELFGSNLTQDPRDFFFFAHRFRQPKNGSDVY